MAKKVIKIATNPVAPSAQKQEKAQWFVDWWRKADYTAKTLYTELLYRAGLGDELNRIIENIGQVGDIAEALERTERKLGKAKIRFEELRAEENKVKPQSQEEQEKQKKKLEIYNKAITKLESQLENLKARQSTSLEAILMNSLNRENILGDLETKVLHYATLGDKGEPRLLTIEVLGKVTHIVYGHTHVSTKGEEVKGLDENKVLVSNSASMTGAVMTRQLKDDGTRDKRAKEKNPETDLRNLGVLFYRTEGGEIKEIIRLGELLAQKIEKVAEKVQQIPKPTPEAATSTGQNIGSLGSKTMGVRRE
jgi:hypothetical protein